MDHLGCANYRQGTLRRLPRKKTLRSLYPSDIGNTSTYIPLKYILFHQLLRLLETSCKLLESNRQTTILITKNCHLIHIWTDKSFINFIESNTLPLLAQPIQSLINVLHWMPCLAKDNFVKSQWM